ncbi:MAG: GDSL-type esterase/lipase family protein [Sulfitobacter sp.]
MRTLIILGVMGLWFLVGVLVGHTKAFPFDVLRAAKIAILGPDLTPDPAGVARSGLFDSFVRDVDVVMIGDSLTARGTWSDIFPQNTITNRGIGGDRADQVLARLDAILATKPDHAFVMIGINDIFAGREQQDILADIEAILKELGQAGVAVYLQSTLECYEEICADNREAVLALNIGLRRLAEQSNIPFIDVNAQVSDGGGLRLDLTHDGIHLNAHGYALWRDMLIPYMPN